MRTLDIKNQITPLQVQNYECSYKSKIKNQHGNDKLGDSTVQEESNNTFSWLILDPFNFSWVDCIVERIGQCGRATIYDIEELGPFGNIESLKYEYNQDLISLSRELSREIVYQTSTASLFRSLHKSLMPAIYVCGVWKLADMLFTILSPIFLRILLFMIDSPTTNESNYPMWFKLSLGSAAIIGSTVIRGLLYTTYGLNLRIAAQRIRNALIGVCFERLLSSRPRQYKCEEMSESLCTDKNNVDLSDLPTPQVERECLRCQVQNNKNDLKPVREMIETAFLDKLASIEHSFENNHENKTKNTFRKKSKDLHSVILQEYICKKCHRCRYICKCGCSRCIINLFSCQCHCKCKKCFNINNEKSTREIISLYWWESFSLGELNNFISVDSERIYTALCTLHDLWAVPLHCIILLLLIYKQIPFAFFVGIIFIG